MVDGLACTSSNTAADDPGAPVVVLVHGVFDSCASFDARDRAPGPRPHRASPTTGGDGHARPTAAPATSLDDHAATCSRRWVSGGPRVVGHSYGGTVALLAAVRRPDLVAALGCSSPRCSGSRGGRRWTRSPREAPDEQDALPRRARGPAAPTPRGARPRTGAAGARAHAHRRRRRARSRADRPVRRRARCTLSARWRFATTDHLRDELGCELIVIEDAGHTAHRMQPKGFADFARRAVGARDGDALMHVVEHAGRRRRARGPARSTASLDSGESFDGVVAELTPEYTVVTYDRRGWGRSRDDAPPTSLADHAQDAIAVLGGGAPPSSGTATAASSGSWPRYLRPDLVGVARGVRADGPVDRLVARLRRDDAPVGRPASRCSSAGATGMPRRTPEQRAADEVSMARDFSFVVERAVRLRRRRTSRAWSAAASTPRRGTTSRASGSPSILDADLVRVRRRRPHRAPHAPARVRRLRPATVALARAEAG